jgi:hypothetical protein
MRRSSWLRQGILGGLAGLSLTGAAWGQSQSETTVQSFSPSVVMSARAEPPSFWQRMFGWLPWVGSSSNSNTTLSTTTRAGQGPGGYNGYNGMSPGEMMGTRPLQGTPVGTYRPIH